MNASPASEPESPSLIEREIPCLSDGFRGCASVYQFKRKGHEELLGAGSWRLAVGKCEMADAFVFFVFVQAKPEPVPLC